jgi:hypothetical protein
MKRAVMAVFLTAALGLPVAALAAVGLQGTYKTKIGASVLGGRVKGTWTVTFKSPNYTIVDNGIAVVRGKYAVNGHVVTFHDKTGPAACPNPGTYLIALTGSKLKFARILDSNSKCAGREAVLAGSFTKVD